MGKKYRLQAETGSFEIKVSEDVSFMIESHDLLISNRIRLRKILDMQHPERSDLMDALIALHLILEIGLNAFYRNLFLMAYKIPIKRIRLIEHIDSVSFIDKTRIFISASKFDFGEHSTDVESHSKLVGNLCNFARLRNLLLHGHGVITVSQNGKQANSELKDRLTRKTLTDQVGRFRRIIEDVDFFLDHLESGLSLSGKQSLKDEFLSIAFLE